MYLILSRVFFLIFYFATVSLADNDIVVSDTNSISILEHSEVFIDDKHLDISKVIKSNSFKKFHNDYLNIGITKKAVWVKFTLSNPTDTKIERLLIIKNNMLENFTLYKCETSQYVKIDYKTNDLHILFPSYKISIAKNENKTYYFYVKNVMTGTRFGLSLQKEKEYLLYDKKQQFLYGLKIGFVLSLIILNIILFFYMKDKTFLYYSLNELPRCKQRGIIEYSSIPLKIKL
jgi:hypothetical protein